MTETLLPALSRGHARVVTVSSGGMYLQGLRPDDWHSENAPYDGAKTYARAKRALVEITRHWSQAHAASGITFNSMHLGWAATPGVARSLPTFNRVLKNSLRDSRMGADSLLWLVSSPALKSVTGRFWLDRRPYATALLPGTAVSPEQRQALLQLVRSTYARAESRSL
jgi:NAD(P)-dependent dehydrogenase (short-subunit alcohol dehydrogenase family)